jgi:hypothetical protein
MSSSTDEGFASQQCRDHETRILLIDEHTCNKKLERVIHLASKVSTIDRLWVLCRECRSEQREWRCDQFVIKLTPNTKEEGDVK